MEVYSIEIYVNGLNIVKAGYPTFNRKYLQIQVKCTDILNFTIKYLKASTTDVRGSPGSGMAGIFPCSETKIISDIGSNLEISVIYIDPEPVELGFCYIDWDNDFSQRVLDFATKNKKYVERNKDFLLRDRSTNNQIGDISLHVSLAYYGTTIQLPINDLGSQLNVPLPYRLSDEGNQSTSSEKDEPWKPLFFAPKKQARSNVDTGLRIFAELAGFTPDPPITSLLSPEYINNHLCGEENCPGAKLFQDFGLGPLAKEGSTLGTITSLATAKPYGLYGMSQAYGTLDGYGAYGLFVKRKGKRKSICDSPDCPYTKFYDEAAQASLPKELINNKAKRCLCKNCRKCIKGKKIEEPPIEEATSFDIAYQHLLPEEGQQICCGETLKDIKRKIMAEVHPELEKLQFHETVEYFEPPPQCAFINKNPRQAAGAHISIPDQNCPHCQQPLSFNYPEWYGEHQAEVKHYNSEQSKCGHKSKHSKQDEGSYKSISDSDCPQLFNYQQQSGSKCSDWSSQHSESPLDLKHLANSTQSKYGHKSKHPRQAAGADNNTSDEDSYLDNPQQSSIVRYSNLYDQYLENVKYFVNSVQTKCSIDNKNFNEDSYLNNIQQSSVCKYSHWYDQLQEFPVDIKYFVNFVPSRYGPTCKYSRQAAGADKPQPPKCPYALPSPIPHFDSDEIINNSPLVAYNLPCVDCTFEGGKTGPTVEKHRLSNRDNAQEEQQKNKNICSCNNPKCPHNREDNSKKQKCSDDPSCPNYVGLARFSPCCKSTKCRIYDPNTAKESSSDKKKQKCSDDPSCPSYVGEKQGNAKIVNCCNNPKCPNYVPNIPKKSVNPSGKKKPKCSDDPSCPNYVEPAKSPCCNNPKCPNYVPTVPKESPKKPKCSDDPSCPNYVGKKQGDAKNSTCNNPKCPNYAGETQGDTKNSTCNNPRCPNYVGKKQGHAKTSTCNNPKCPNYAGETQEDTKNSTCNNPKCPNYVGRKQGHAKNSTCNNPKCPNYVKEKQGDAKNATCNNPKCPNYVGRKQGDAKTSTCNNPKCPNYVGENQGDAKTSTCNNPKCPNYVGEKQGDTKNSTCNNPKCPNYVPIIPKKSKNSSVKFPCCNNPQCPNYVEESQEDDEDSICCNDPNCPNYVPNTHEESPYSTGCKNPKCPYFVADTSEEYSSFKTPCCKNPNCPNYVPCIPQDFSDTTVCSDLSCLQYKDEKPEKKLCDQCNEEIRASQDKSKQLSLLTNEGGEKMLINAKKHSLNKKDLLSSLSLGEDTDIFYMLSRIMMEKQNPMSAVNNFNPFESEGKPDTVKPKTPRGPCNKDSCKTMSYKTCSECGGISRSGATCDNTDVSFSTISYDSLATDADITPQPPEKIVKRLATPTAMKSDDKSKHIQKSTSEKIVKIHKQKIKKSRFVYNAGEYYPGIRIGHKEKPCTGPGKRKPVPSNMGWLWTFKDDFQRVKKKKNWKPGFLSDVIMDRIVRNRRRKGIPDPPELKMLVKKQKTKLQVQGDSEDEEEEEIEPKPTLTIQKKEGNYLITLNPLKDPKTLAENENPYIKCKPMQFLIIKPKKEHSNKNSNEIIGEDEYSPYFNQCFCDDEKDSTESSSSSNSELDIEFTTPAGIIIPERMKRQPNVVHTDTQFKEADFTCADCEIIIPKKFKKDRRKGKKLI